MSLHAELTREIDEGPSGPHIGAFFDVDRTLIAGFSVFEFFRDALVSGGMSPAEVADTVATAARFQMGQVGFSAFVAGTAGSLRGRSEAEFAQTGERIFSERVAATIYPESRALVDAHRRKGHTVALVSAATHYQIDPLARDLGIPHVLCTQLKVRKGQFTGEVVRPTCYGEGKLQLTRKLAKRAGVDMAESYFYTDSDEDLALLDGVGHPRPTNPNRRLSHIATRRGWPTRTFFSRGRPGVLDVLRTSLAVGSLVPSFLLAVPAAVIQGDWRHATNIVSATWGEVGSALAGVSVQITGEEHLWSHRPAVFIFNHQSGIDMMLLCKLLRRDIVGIAKQEVRRNPIFGPMMAMAGTVFIDRFDREKAIAALQPALDTLREGISLVIAPEGTRSPTPHLGKFKKGAFHLAMAAKAAIVPIVFRNALDALPKHAMIVRPATVEVVVHPPIPTAAWKPEQLDRRIAAIHKLYTDTLNL